MTVRSRVLFISIESPKSESFSSRRLDKRSPCFLLYAPYSELWFTKTIYWSNNTKALVLDSALKVTQSQDTFFGERADQRIPNCIPYLNSMVLTFLDVLSTWTVGFSPLINYYYKINFVTTYTKAGVLGLSIFGVCCFTDVLLSLMLLISLNCWSWVSKVIFFLSWGVLFWQFCWVAIRSLAYSQAISQTTYSCH